MIKKVHLILILIASTTLFSAKKPDLDTMYQNSIYSLDNRSLDSAKVDGLIYLAEAKESEDEYHLIQAYFILGYISNQSENFGDAVIYYLEASRIGEKSSNKEVIKTLISIYKNLSIILGNFNYYNLAHIFNEKALILAKKVDNFDQIININGNIINDLLEEKQYSAALQKIKSLRKSFILSERQNIQLKNKEALAYKNLDLFDKAEECYHYIIKKDHEINPAVYSHSLHNIANLSLLKGDPFEQSIRYFERAIEFKKETKLWNELFMSLNDLGEAYYSQKEYKNALKYLHEAEDLMTSRYLIDPDLYKIYQLMSEVYGKIGIEKQAEKYANLYFTEDSNKTQNIQLLTERHLELIKASVEKEKSNTLFRMTLGLVVLLLIGLIYTSIKYKQIKQYTKEGIIRIINRFSEPKAVKE